MAALKEKYKKEIIPALCQEHQYKNIMQTPQISKIVVNMGVGEALQNAKALDFACKDLAEITGQKPIITHAKKSIAGFKLRKGNAVGCRVTLRGEKMYEFLDRLVGAALPRIRDFRGMSEKSFDGRGNYNFGLTEQVMFPEIEYDKIDKMRGMDIAIVTTAKTDKEARSLLAKFGMPFSRKSE